MNLSNLLYFLKFPIKCCNNVPVKSLKRKLEDQSTSMAVCWQNTNHINITLSIKQYVQIIYIMIIVINSKLKQL